MSESPARGLVLLAHGSRDPLWRRPVQAVQTRLAEAAPQLAVRCAYLELCAPDLASAVQELQAAGLERITVVPLFFGAGRHVREDLPRLVQELADANPGLSLRLAPVAGEDARLIALLAELATEAALLDK